MKSFSSLQLFLPTIVYQPRHIVLPIFMLWGFIWARNYNILLDKIKFKKTTKKNKKGSLFFFLWKHCVPRALRSVPLTALGRGQRLKSCTCLYTGSINDFRSKELKEWRENEMFWSLTTSIHHFSSYRITTS